LPSLLGLLSDLWLKTVAGPQIGKTKNGEASNRDQYPMRSLFLLEEEEEDGDDEGDDREPAVIREPDEQ
jgi:hypothetical protein